MVNTEVVSKGGTNVSISTNQALEVMNIFHAQFK